MAVTDASSSLLISSLGPTMCWSVGHPPGRSLSTCWPVPALGRAALGAVHPRAAIATRRCAPRPGCGAARASGGKTPAAVRSCLRRSCPRRQGGRLWAGPARRRPGSAARSAVGARPASDPKSRVTGVRVSPPPLFPTSCRQQLTNSFRVGELLARWRDRSDARLGRHRGAVDRALHGLTLVQPVAGPRRVKMASDPTTLRRPGSGDRAGHPWPGWSARRPSRGTAGCRSLPRRPRASTARRRAPANVARRPRPPAPPRCR